MKLRYMVEYALRDRIKDPHYEPIGVWVQGPGPGLDIEMAYLPGNAEAEEEAEWVINRLVEAGVKNLAEDFLEYHQQTLSPYRGMRGVVVKTEEFSGSYQCSEAVLQEIRLPHASSSV